MTSTPPGFSTPAPVSGASTAARDNVYHVVASWARRAPGGRLNAWLVGGVVDAVGLWLFLPVLWPLACAFLSIAAVGGWGLAAQQLAAVGADSVRRRRALETAMFAALVAGTLAAILAFYGVLLAILGPSWKL